MVIYSYEWTSKEEEVGKEAAKVVGSRREEGS